MEKQNQSKNIDSVSAHLNESIPGQKIEDTDTILLETNQEEINAEDVSLEIIGDTTKSVEERNEYTKICSSDVSLEEKNASISKVKETKDRLRLEKTNSVSRPTTRNEGTSLEPTLDAVASKFEVFDLYRIIDVF